jgi:hypothetical protein
MLIAIPAFLKVKPVNVNSVKWSCRFVGVWASRYLAGYLRHRALLTLRGGRPAKSHAQGLSTDLSEGGVTWVSQALVPQVCRCPGCLTRVP